MSGNKILCRICLTFIVELLRLIVIPDLCIMYSIAVLPITVKSVMCKKLNKLILLHYLKIPV